MLLTEPCKRSREGARKRRQRRRRTDRLRVESKIIWSAEAVHWVEGNTSGHSKAWAEGTHWCWFPPGWHRVQEQSLAHCFDSG